MEFGSNPVHQMTFATSSTRPSSVRQSIAYAATCGARSTPAAARSSGLARTSGIPWGALRPLPATHGVVWSGRDGRDRRNSGRKKRAENDSIRNGGGRIPTREAHRAPSATSSAISAPELPAPTSRTSPSWSWPDCGRRRSAAGRWRGQARRPKDGKHGRCQFPSRRRRCRPRSAARPSTTKPLPFLESRSTRPPFVPAGRSAPRSLEVVSHLVFGRVRVGRGGNDNPARAS